MNELDSEQLMLYRGGSLANRTAKQESVERLLTSVISGQKCGELLTKLDRSGSFVKMYGDYCQVKMDGSLEEYSEIFPTWGLMLDGAVYELQMSEQFTDENEWELLPTVITSDSWTQTFKTTEWDGKSKHSRRLIQALNHGKENQIYLNPSYLEVLMGFPIGWTELNH